jgi:SAM-dependent methyltransferase
MSYDREAAVKYWDQDNVESMYDKHLLSAEIALVKPLLSEGSRILDAGCGEGEGTVEYASVSGVQIDAVDFSRTRLDLARKRLHSCANVTLRFVDLLAPEGLRNDYDHVISQRFLINLTEWPLQMQVLQNLIACLKPRGTLILLEGWQDGVDQLNWLRRELQMAPIPVRWHNLFLRQDTLVGFMLAQGCRLVAEDGVGPYFLLTRGVRPYFDAELSWDCEFNRLAAAPTLSSVFADRLRFSRLKLWVFRKG